MTTPDIQSPPTPTDRREECTNCRFAIFQDTGYSNWTVEGCTFFCALGVHPADGFDSYYSTDPGLKYAAECDAFEAGTCIELDVDGENEPTEDQLVILRKWEKNNE